MSVFALLIGFRLLENLYIDTLINFPICTMAIIFVIMLLLLTLLGVSFQSFFTEKEFKFKALRILLIIEIVLLFFIII